MSDVEPTSPGASTGKTIISVADQKFIMSLLNNTTGGNVSVDVAAVAAELGFSNLKSVSNKMAKMKKEYGIPFTTGKPSASTTSAGDTDAKTPKKAKVPTEKKTPKKRAAPVHDDEGEPTTTPKKRKSPVKKAVPKPKVEEDQPIAGSDDEGTDTKKEMGSEDEGMDV